jgi:hypothetical protein
MPRHRLPIVFVVILTTALAAGTLAASPSAPAASKRPPGTWCGGKLWRLMTLSDRDRFSVDLHSVPTSINSVSALSAPAIIGTRRSTDYQRHVFRMQTVLDRYRIASNGEIVLVLFSIPTNQYMNAYLANPDCLSARSRNRTGMIAARDELRKHCPVPTVDWQLIGATVDVGGVGFWNPNRTTRGALPNGAELRPVTNFRLITGCGVG